MFLSLFCPGSIFAVSVTIPNFPPTIASDPFTITASISGAASGTNYIRVDLYKEGVQSYFGETYNGSDWCSSSIGKEYFPISIQSGKIWSGDVVARVGDPSLSDYDGQGSYRMRIRRYTSSGSSGSENPNDSSVSIAINVPTPTPTPAPTEIPAPASNPATATPTSSPTLKITATPTTKPTVKPASNVAAATSSSIMKTGDVLSESSQSAEVEKPTVTPQDVKIASDNKNNLLAKLLIFVGIVFLLACGIVFSYPYIVRFKNRNVSE